MARIRWCRSSPWACARKEWEKVRSLWNSVVTGRNTRLGETHLLRTKWPLRRQISGKPVFLYRKASRQFNYEQVQVSRDAVRIQLRGFHPMFEARKGHWAKCKMFWLKFKFNIKFVFSRLPSFAISDYLHKVKKKLILSSGSPAPFLSSIFFIFFSLSLPRWFCASSWSSANVDVKRSALNSARAAAGLATHERLPVYSMHCCLFALAVSPLCVCWCVGVLVSE